MRVMRGSSPRWGAQVLAIAWVGSCGAPEPRPERAPAPAANAEGSGAAARASEPERATPERATPERATPRPTVDETATIEPLRARLLAEPTELRAAAGVRAFYEQRDYRPAWTREGRATATATEAAAALARLDEHGLDPRRYAAPEPAAGGDRLEDPAAFELGLTDAWLTAADHLVHGVADPVKLHPTWTAKPREVDLGAALREGLREGNPGQVLLGLGPRYPEYAALQAALRELRAQANPREAKASIDTVRVNLERWRWLPDELGPRHVRVSIAAFEIALYEDGTPTLRMRAVVGKRHRKTPVFSTTITHVTINPHWSVPTKLAINDVLPEILRDPGVLERKGFRVLRARDHAMVDPSTVPWAELGPRHFPYLLWQEPGPTNSLGRFKLEMPNDYDIFLHDTPKHHLFDEERRTYSSGCTRMERPRDLAVALLRGHSKWTPTKLDAAVNDGRELSIALPAPIPAHFLYFTGWVDDAGALQLRDDVYGWDPRVLAVLGSLPSDRG